MKVSGIQASWKLAHQIIGKRSDFADIEGFVLLGTQFANTFIVTRNV
jgi:hypothetical protein